MSYASADERYFASLINDVRRKEGLGAVKLEVNLNEAAESHNSWILATDNFSHTGKNGSKVGDRAEAAGFAMYGESWWLGENLGYVSIDNDGSLRDEIRAIHNNLLDSSSHYATIVKDRAEYVGIALEVGNFNGHRVLMATQVFGDTTGQGKVDTGSFPVVKMPGVDLRVESYASWLRDQDGLTITYGPDGEVRNGSILADDFQLGGRNDRAFGALGDDWMSGGGGNDTMQGQVGRDIMLGGSGNDRLNGNVDDDTLIGGGGNDTLEGEKGIDLLNGGVGFDKLWGGDGNDRLLGGANNDYLNAGLGDDWLQGDAGNDKLLGGAGADTLIGGAGNDVLNGGAGGDTFIFAPGFGKDRVLSYEADIDEILISRKLITEHPDAFLRDHVTDTALGVQVDLGDGNVITFVGKGLTAADIVDDIALI